MRLGAVNFTTNYSNKLQSGNLHNAKKQINFGESDDAYFRDCTPPCRSRDNIEREFAERRKNLADKADFIEMSAERYYDELHKLNDAEKSELFRNDY